jgi:hypothetical protein
MVVVLPELELELEPPPPPQPTNTKIVKTIAMNGVDLLCIF